MIKLKNKQSGELFDLPYKYNTGLIMYNGGEPTVFHEQPVFETSEKLTVKLPYSISELFEFVNIDDEPIDPEPPLTNETPLLLTVWGNGGRPFPSSHRTHANECWVLSQPEFIANRPFYSYLTEPRMEMVDVFENGQQITLPNGQKKGEFRECTVDYLVSEPVMIKIIDYVKEAGLNGFAMLYYADDSPLSVWRHSFANLEDKKGVSCCFGVYQFGGDDRRESELQKYALNLKQDWWTRTKNGKKLIYALVEGSDEQAESSMYQRQSDIREILAYAGLTMDDCYFVLMSGGADVRQFTGKANDASKFWHEYTYYYFYSDYKLGFGHVANLFADAVKDELYAPNISCGLDSRGRRKLEYGNSDMGGYYDYEEVLEVIPRMVNEWKKVRNEKQVGFVNHGDEGSEQAKAFLPVIPKNGGLDRRMIDKFKYILK